ncbi:DUF234 domain-containing protein [Sulfurovum sp. TSL1]|uniref:DUF234 domain-containing protein n=1 Tax=Sulfurovum sp. TSL1 TaxID=2826994 RepID=UPI001CC58E89|nr:DUF234 domain-containing protein [Sulfurovum sp. TSL1]GIT98188.1 hypothetical protein TSL1_10090 [Sulfurovum sp. TSL1]
MELEQAVEYFSILGGIGKNIELDYFDDVFSMVESNFVQNFSKFQALVSPSYLLESPYREILMAVARGDGKLYSVLRKAKVSEALGEKIVGELVDLNVLKVEASRESPLRSHPKHKLKKEQRSYRVQDKLRFVQPFMRFWFGFVTYYKKDLAAGKGDAFLKNFEKHYERLRSLVYEQLCDALLIQHYAEHKSIVDSGSFWNIHSEFDILAVSQDKKVILGECKYKDRKVCKNELTKLKAKAAESGIKVDVYALFSKSGFSNELLQAQDDDLLLFDLNDLEHLL